MSASGSHESSGTRRGSSVNAGSVEVSISNKNEDEKLKVIGMFELFRFSDALDRLLMVSGLLFAAVHGTALPLLIIVFGEMTDLFIQSGVSGNVIDILEENGILAMYNLTKAQVLDNPVLLQPHLSNIETKYNLTINSLDSIGDQLLESMTKFAVYYIIIACLVMLCGYCQVAFWVISAERQAYKIRHACFRSILRQEIGWFDVSNTGELNTRLSDDIGKIQEGIGDKMGSLMQWVASFLTGFIVGFVYGWKLTLVILATSPLMAIAAIMMSKLVMAMTDKEHNAYAKAGAVAEEVISSIRTVIAFAGQDKECKRYSSNLKEAYDYGVRKGFTTGLSMGFLWLIIFCMYGLGFWYGAKLVREESDSYKAGNILIVFFGVIIGAFSLGNAAPGLQSVSVARGVAYTIYKIIDLKPDIDSSSADGKRFDVVGNLEFKQVLFTYPARPDVKVLKGINLKVASGQTVALVGPSGCGKSTTVQLIQRFYDPQAGEVLLDGHNIKDINLKYLREQLGVVSQEPVLFATTIAENIRYGKDNISQSKIEAAAKQANAYDFIMNLPQKFETLVGERGAQLSGGQKQRIAIARALVKDPKVLLLDEATSALDSESEAIVQEALDKARSGRTTIIVAHRLSTVKTADVIVGFQDGIIEEKGTHEELVTKGGIYYQLVTSQTKREDEGSEDEDFDLHERVGSARGSQRKLQRMVSATSETSYKRKMSVSEAEEEKLPDTPTKRILQMNSPEWMYILLGCISAMCNGGIQPAFAFIFSEILGVFSEQDEEKQKNKIMIYALVFVGLGFLSCITYFLQGYMFSKSGEGLTMRLRKKTFQAMLKQDISWFDDHRNNTGALTTRLSTDASQVHGATGVRLGTIVQSLANIGTALVIAFIYGWKLTLAIMAFLPFIVLASFLQMKILIGVAGKNKAALEDAGKIAVEAIENIRTLVALTREETFVKLYNSKTIGPHKNALKSAHVHGISFSFSQAIIFFAYAASFWFGAYLIRNNEMDYIAVFKVFSCIVFGAMALGQASSFTPDYSKAKISASRIFALLDNPISVDSSSERGRTLEGYLSAVSFHDVKFCYPTRPTVTVLQGLTVDVQPGQTLALVGSSGCGKSTCVQLIERFYDPKEGAVLLDDTVLTELNVQWLRSQIGIVSQEPVLFDCSISDNIAYGDNSRTVSTEEVVAAALAANIHSFIQSLPMGYHTNVGDKGAQLSGGQKQRVAIARALVRNPKILLLDEATSALDTESEKVVQEALDRAREGRTCIVIAHRLSTVQNADKIAVIRSGQVVEQGSHSELLNKRGFYYRLVAAQRVKK